MVMNTQQQKVKRRRRLRMEDPRERSRHLTTDSQLFNSSTPNMTEGPAVGEPFERCPSAEAALETYRVGKMIGQGGFGVIHKAKHEGTGATVALKVIEKSKVPSRIKRLCLPEGEAMALLEHSNVVELQDWIETEDSTILVMSYAKKGDLLDEIMYRRKSRTGFSESEVARIFAQLCLAVEHCHSRGVAHCDVKPDNVFLDKKGDVWLGDLGLAVEIEEGVEKCPLIGTVNYASPEVICGKKLTVEQLRKVDVWGLGILLYILASLRYPFYSADKDQLKRNIVGEQELEFPQGTPGYIVNLCSAMLERDVNQRLSLNRVMSHSWIANQIALCRVTQRLKQRSQAGRRKDRIRPLLSAGLEPLSASKSCPGSPRRWSKGPMSPSMPEAEGHEPKAPTTQKVSMSISKISLPASAEAAGHRTESSGSSPDMS